MNYRMNDAGTAKQSEADLLEKIIARLPAGLRLLSSPIRDYVGKLHSSELRCIENAVDKRRFEFSTGRWLARELFRELGVPEQPLLPSPQRDPAWPKQIVGSITHSSSMCAVLAAYAKDYRALGIDLELSSPPNADLADIILSPLEPARYRSPEMLRLIFSAKESVYKGLYPITGTMLDFHDVEIRLQESQLTFSVVTSHEKIQTTVERGSGLFETAKEGCLTLFAIPFNS